MKISELDIRSLMQKDWPVVQEIYGQGIDTEMATFETEVPEWKDWDESHLSHSRLVAERDTTILGWAALSPVSDRCVYSGVAEVSIYIAESARGYGVGKELLESLVHHSEQNGIWTLQAGVFAENKVSITLHEKCCFRVIGRREKLGRLHGEWKDVMLLERRSNTVGMN